MMNHPERREKSRFPFVLGVLLFLLGWTSACTTPTPPPVPAPSPTPTTEISREKAIETATAGCQTPRLVLIGDPQNIRAELMTLEEADGLLREPGESNTYAIPMDRLVWLVQMDGTLQLIGGPAPIDEEGNRVVNPTPRPPSWGTCTVILDATSGDRLSIHGNWHPSDSTPPPTPSSHTGQNIFNHQGHEDHKESHRSKNLQIGLVCTMCPS